MKLKKILNQLNVWSVQAEAWMQVCHAAMDRFPELFLPVTSDPKAEHSAEVIIGLLDELYDRRRSDEAMRDFVTSLLPSGRSLAKSELFTDMLKRYPSQPPPSDLATELMARFMETGAKQHEQVFGKSPAENYVRSYCETHRVYHPANAVCPLCASFRIPFSTQKATAEAASDPDPKTAAAAFVQAYCGRHQMYYPAHGECLFCAKDKEQKLYDPGDGSMLPEPQASWYRRLKNDVTTGMATCDRCGTVRGKSQPIQEFVEQHYPLPHPKLEESD